MKQTNCLAITTRLFKLVVAALALIFPVAYALAAPCDLKNSPPPFIQHNLTASPTTSVSYCELCGYGYVTIVISNPYVGNGTDETDMINMTVQENLGTSGLTYTSAAPTPMTYSVNGGASQVGGAPTISGAVLSWTSTQIPALSLLQATPSINNFPTIAITFAVTVGSLNQEALITASRQIQASLSYSTNPVCTVSSPVLTTPDILPLREPIPSMTKLGRNVDAAQDDQHYSNPVYGNINDNVIWRIQVNNSGMAGLQDMHFDDLMQNGNMSVNYACPSEAAASAIAAANGVGPGTQGCVPASNTISSFAVDSEFGTPSNLVDVPASGYAQIYLVGKITSSCVSNKTNTVSNLQWGCANNSPAVDTSHTSTGFTPLSSNATLSSLVVPANLQVTRSLTGINTAQHVGSSGIMTIAITNNTGGSIKNIKLQDILPPEYVVDSTFTPTVVVSGGYGPYPGRLNTITWTNPIAGTFPLTSTTPADPLSNTQPTFTLTSANPSLNPNSNPNDSNQVNMLRANETATVQFHVVMIKPTFFDLVANLDIYPETPTTTPPTDPDNSTTLSNSNSLTIQYDSFCNADPQNPYQSITYTDTFASNPEDLDINIPGTSFIITDDSNQLVTLPVFVINNGGDDARNYHVFVSFGATIQVQTPQSGCNLISPLSGSPPEPTSWKVWTKPSGIPASASVYECDSGGAALPAALGHGASRTLNFQVIKSTDPTKIAIDDLSFRADVVGEITLYNGTPLWFPTPDTPTARADGQVDRANNYSLDGFRARVVGFNLTKTQPTGSYCSENNPPPIPSPSHVAPVPYDNLVQIGEECPYHIESGGWFGFNTPGFTLIAVQDVQLLDQLPSGQAYISSTPPVVDTQIPAAEIVTGTGVPFVPGPFTPLYQGVFGWDFNWTSQITVPNQWFKVNTTSRILNCNSPLLGQCASPTVSPNIQAAPSTNVLNASFNAVFQYVDTNGVTQTQTLPFGSTTVGYPTLPTRSVKLTATEPKLTLAKTVCNETLSLTGTGAACTPFGATANGDTYDKYIYKITVTNAASAGGAARAPAYNVVVTDTLDATGLSYVEPLASDGLDNDGNAITDDTTGIEGAVSNNVLNNTPQTSSPAVITFSYSDNPSSKLWQINPGQTVKLLYRVAPSLNTSAGQTLTNSVVATYDSLKYYFNTTNVYGSQTGPLGGDGTFDGARTYKTAPATASIVMETPITQPKLIVKLSQQPVHATPVSAPAAQPVSIGEEIQYQLHTSLPIVDINNFSITDNLPVGVRCSEALPIVLNVAPYNGVTFNSGAPITITPTCTNNQVQWNMGNLALSSSSGSNYDFVVNFIGQVQNIAGTLNGATLSNGGSSTDVNMQYTDSTGTVVKKQFINADVIVQEPKIVLTKTYSQATADAADVITVTVSAQNTGTATAYNLQVLDDLSLAPHLSYIPGSVNGTDPPDVVNVTALGANRPIFNWNSTDPKYAIAPGVTRTFTYKVLVANVVQPLEVLSSNTLNPMQAKWDSLPGKNTALNSTGFIGDNGTPTGLRNGALPNTGTLPNLYETGTSAISTVPAVTITKKDLSPAVVPTIGAYKQFEIDIALPEGTTNNLQISDNLAAAGLSYLLSNNATYSMSYTFQNIASINGNATPGAAAFTAPPPADGTTGNALWNIGTVITQSEDDSVAHAINPLIKIVYWARVDNNSSIISGALLQNSVLASYTNGSTGNSIATLPVTTPLITVVEPKLTLGKTMTNISVPGALPAGLNVLEYTLTLTNTGNSTAYDINIADTLPPQLTYYASFTPTATINGTAVAGFVPVPNGQPAGPLVWGRNNGDGSLDLPAAQTLLVKYQVIVDGSAVPGAVLNNSAIADWTSLDGPSPFERTAGLGCSNYTAANPPNNYCVGPAVATSTVSAPNPLSKMNTQATAAIGQQFKYHITVPAVPKSTAMYDVNIFDNLGLSAADMSYVSVTPVSGPAWTPQVSGAPKNLVISGSGTGLDIPAGQQAVFDVTVVLNDTAQNVSGLLFHNTASYIFNSTKGNNGSQSVGGTGITADMTIVGPDSVTLQKTGPANMRIGTPDSFTLNIQNTGSGTAWDMTIVDKLPPSPKGMCATAPSAITAQMFQANGTTAVGTVLVAGTDYTANFAACTLTFTMKSPAAAIAPSNRLILNYQAALDTDNVAGTTLTNIAGATQWFSAVAPVTNAGTGHTFTKTITDGTPTVLDFQDAHSITTLAPLLNFRKTVANITSGGSGATAKPGDVLQYTVTLNNLSSSTLSNFSIIDELDRLNAAAMFVPGSLTLITIPAGASATLTTVNGGSKGTGLVNIQNLSIRAQGSGSDTLTIVFQAKLAAVITSGTTVLNQAQLPTYSTTPLDSDDLGDATNGVPTALPTKTVITSAPIMQVKKISQDITGDPLVLMAGDTLRYIITIKNIGNENAINVSIHDTIPANTTYVPGTTQLNGVAVPDLAAGVSALQNGMPVNAVEDPTTPGVMRADASATVSNVATITFNVKVNANDLNGTIISNQGFVDGSGQGSGPFVEVPSDDPSTPVLNDPTRNIVGNNPLLSTLKTVAIQFDYLGDGIVDPSGGDVLRYTITINNQASIPATGVNFTDLVPANTTYVANTVTLNGNPVGQPDGGVSPLILGIGVNSPTSAPGTIAAHSSAVVTFDVLVSPTPLGTVISNQGSVTSNELPSQLTDADGNSSNGYQPTTIVVGSDQQVSISKQVTVVGGGPALANGQLDYLVVVTNTGKLPATNVVITDDLGLPPLSTQVTYVPGSATLNGLTTGANFTGNVLTATYGTLVPGATAQLHFRVTITTGLVLGTTITNTGKVAWSNTVPALTATASVSIDVGGIPGSAILNGHVWHDANFNKIADSTELNLAGWAVNVYRNNTLLGSTTTDSNGLYSISGLTPTTTIADQYLLQFDAPGAGATTAKLGRADSLFTNGMQQIAGITAASGSSIQNLNLPISPNGVVYNSILRTPVIGALLTMVRAGSSVPLQPACFDDPAQQGQVTLAFGYYKFDLNFSDPSCPSGGDYLIQVASPLAYIPGQSQIVPPVTDALTATFSVPNCPGTAADAIPSTTNYCEAQPSEFAPGVAVPAATVGTNYYLHMTFNNSFIPGHSEVFDNHIPLDPHLDNAVTITKVAGLQNVTKGQLVPYTITVNNTLSVTLNNMSIVDNFPLGFKYVAGSGRLDGQPVEPVTTTRTLTWGNLQLVTNIKHVIQMLLVVGSGVSEGKYINRAQVFNTVTGGAASQQASATVRVVPDPTLDCSDVIGKVFDDVNLNGYQDEGEKGLPGVRVVTVNGLVTTTDNYGRFHLTCAVVPDPDRGSNFILKVDDRSLPSGYRITTENPRVERATRGKMLKFNFGAAIHRVVKLDLADGVFEPGTTEMRVQWKQRLELLLDELKKSASVLRLSYMAETEQEGLVNDRLKIVKNEISRMWKSKNENYDLTIETEVFWRTGAPPERGVTGQ